MTTTQSWSLRPIMEAKLARQEITGDQYELFQQVAVWKEEVFDTHEINVNNRCTKWWKQGEATEAQARELVVQFGGFSKRFPLIQELRVFHAETEVEEEDALEIVMNENGVGIDKETGSTEGQVFKHAWRHFTWLRDIAELVSIDRMALGRPEYSAPSTLEFNQFLEDGFSHQDRNRRAGISFALESWAGFGIEEGADFLPINETEVSNFWQELLVGFVGFNERQRFPHSKPPLPISFWKYHIGLELHHVKNVEHDLANMIFHPGFNFKAWKTAVIDGLDAIQVFWDGIYDRCMRLETPTRQRRTHSVRGLNSAPG